MSRAARVIPIFVSTIAIAFFAGPGTAQDFTKIDEYVESQMHEQKVPGLALVIVENGAVAHARGFGVADGDGRAMTTTTPLVIGSLSKAITATAVLQLVEQGLIALDRPVRDYLPYFRTADESLSAKITVRHLLNQTSGIPTKAPQAANDDASLADHVRALARVQLVSSPGQGHTYSSPNYQILGAIVEQVTNKPFGAVLQERIFGPLGMKHTFVSEEMARRSGLGSGHNIWFGVSLPSHYAWDSDRLPTASIISSAEDLGRFVAMHLGGGRAGGTQILSPAMTEESHRGAGEAEGFRYAMGWRDGTTAGVPSLGHGGALPNYRGAVVMFRERNLGVVLLSNSSSMFADHTREIARGVVALLAAKPIPPKERSLRTIYLVITIVSVVLLLLQLNALRKAFVAFRPPRLAGIASDVLVPIALLIFIRLRTGVSWRNLFQSAPDILTITWVLVALSLTTGVVKLVRRRSMLQQEGGNAAA